MIRPACPQSFEDFLTLSEELTGKAASPQEVKKAATYRARFYAREAAKESFRRRSMARNLAGSLGTDNPKVLLYVLALRAVNEAAKKSAEQGALAEVCRTFSREKLSHAQALHDRGAIGPDLDALNEARNLVNEAGEHYRAAERYAEQVARYSRGSELLEAALLARRDAAKVSRFLVAKQALELLAARSSLAMDSLDEFTPPESRPRTSDTFAHAPPALFATELRRSHRVTDS